MRLLPFLFLLGACGSDKDPSEDRPDIRVVVIETNIPDELRDAAGFCPYRYESESATRTCGDAQAPPHICSEVELCQEQQDWIFEAFASCQLGEGEVDADALPACP